MILNNFLYRVGEYAHRNRARLIKWALILAAVIIGALLIYYGVERLHEWRYQRKSAAIDKRIEQKDAEIKAAEAYINALKVEIAAKDALLEELDKQYAVAKAAHGKTRTEYVYLESQYEKTRDNPMPVANVTCADLRAELAGLGIR